MLLIRRGLDVDKDGIRILHDRIIINHVECAFPMNPLQEFLQARFVPANWVLALIEPIYFPTRAFGPSLNARDLESFNICKQCGRRNPDIAHANYHNFHGYRVETTDIMI